MSIPIHTIVALRLREKLTFSGSRRKIFLWIVLAGFLVSTGSFIYYKLVYQPNQLANQSPVMQTATVRQGELVISASGTGTLTAADEKGLGFTAGGEGTKLFGKAGAQVKDVDLLAEVDSLDAQVNYIEATHKYRELTSTAAIASAQE